ncbi:MAG: UDP-glucuronic acid decarboxylase family protein [Syntrophomonadaceae bacterium]
MSGKRILVTGGAGFIGTHLCRKLLELGHEVFCLDNLFTGSRENISGMLSNPHFHFIFQDVTSMEPGGRFSWFHSERNQENRPPGYEEIYNLACPASPVHYQYDPVKTVQTSVLGAINVLELAKKTGARVLQASTSEVYGNPLVHPQREDYWGNVNPIGIRSCYDEGKRCAETLFFDYNRQYGADIKVVRIFNTYGPLMRPDDGRVISNFIVQALKGEALTVYGNGRQTRSFCYVDDLLEGLISMMAKPDFTGPVNLGNPAEITMLELADRILALTGSNSSLCFKPLPADDPCERCPDISLVRTRLGWEPLVDLEQGLRRTIDYFRGR